MQRGSKSLQVSSYLRKISDHDSADSVSMGPIPKSRRHDQINIICSQLDSVSRFSVLTSIQLEEVKKARDFSIGEFMMVYTRCHGLDSLTSICSFLRFLQ